MFKISIVVNKNLFLFVEAWETSVKSFLNDTCGRDLSIDEITLVSRRPRLMMSHLWNCKRKTTPVPARYRQLAQLRDAMNVCARDMAGLRDFGESQADDDDHENDDSAAPVDFMASQGSVVTVAGSDDTLVLGPAADHDIDDLLAEMDATDIAETPSSASALVSALSQVEIDALVGTCTAAAPSESAYKVAFKRPASKKPACKRPATAAPSSAPIAVKRPAAACLEEKVRKRIHSAAWHKVRKQCLRDGISADETKRLASEAGARAIAAARAELQASFLE